MAVTPKAKNIPPKAALSSQSPNQPKEDLTLKDGPDEEDEESDADASDEIVGTRATPTPPPVSNENVEPGAEQFDEPPKEKRSTRDRIKDIETRWEKGMEEIMIDLHDHVFGTSPTHEETVAKRKATADAAATESAKE